MTVFLWIVAALLVLVGIAGTVLPAVPGTALVFCGLLIAAWIDHFQRVGWITLAVLGAVALISLGFDIVATGLGARRLGASRAAVIGAALGTVVGLFLGLPGMALGPFVGAVVGEYATRREWGRAGKVGLGTWIGLVLGAAVRLGLAFTMLGIFVASFIL
ncbi:MAG: DUF456 domain-containing protein [Acidobacteriota bacterium]